MEIQTKYHGVIHIEEKDYLRFENGLPGFLDEKTFILLPLEKESAFFILQSQKTSELGFVVVNPFLFFKDYQFNLSENDKEAINLLQEGDIQILTILTVKDPFAETTANLKAPIIINSKSNLAKQIILHDTYQTKHKIIQDETK